MNDFTQTIKKCWSRETSGDQKKRSETNPSYRQCLVTALLANDILGLSVHAEKVVLESGFRGYHFFNKDLTNIPIRFCEDQFNQEKIISRKGERTISSESIQVLFDWDYKLKNKYNVFKNKFQTEIKNRDLEA